MLVRATELWRDGLFSCFEYAFLKFLRRLVRAGIGIGMFLLNLLRRMAVHYAALRHQKPASSINTPQHTIRRGGGGGGAKGSTRTHAPHTTTHTNTKHQKQTRFF
jgi:hypothetical protein